MKIFHDKTPTGKPTSRMVQDKGGKKPTVGVAGWMIFAILTFRAIVATCLKAGTRAALIWIGVVIVGLLGMSLIAAQLANGG